MKILTLLILLVLEVLVTSDTRCACCFTYLPGVCETPAFDIGSCSNCTSWFCAMHVKGCQGQDLCNAVCHSGSSSSTTTNSSTTASSSTIASHPNAGTITVARLPIILIGLTLCHFVELCSMHHVKSFI